MKKIYNYSAYLMYACAFVGAMLAYFITFNDPSTGMTLDGFGRELSERSFMARFLVRSDMQVWAGWKWFFVDNVVGWGLIGLGYFLNKKGKED